MSKIFIGICNSQDYMPSDFFWSMLGQTDFVMKPVFRRFKSSSTCIRNNRLFQEFLDSDCEYLARMDVDQVYPPNYFEVMVPLVRIYKAIGPLIFDRQIGNGFIPLVNWLESFPEHTDISGMQGIIEAPYSHTNYFFHRDVLKNIPKPFFEEVLKGDGFERENMDCAFMKKVASAGHKIYVNLDMVVGHIANVSVDQKFYNKFHGKEGEEK